MWSAVYLIGSTEASRRAQYQSPGEIVPILCSIFQGGLPVKAQSVPPSFLGRFACENNRKLLFFVHQSEMGKQKGTKTSNNASENFPCGSCKLSCKNYCINCFKCNLWFHVACTDLSHENFVALDKINGAFWACVACRAKVIGHQNNETESLHNFQQSVAGIRDDLQKEITEFKSEMLNNIEEIKLTLKNSRYENEPQKITEKLRVNADLTSQSERENKS